MTTKREAEEEHATVNPGKKQKNGVVDAGNDIDALEAAYRKAKAAYKANKTDKDLRTAKSAAKKAWDTAVATAKDELQQEEASAVHSDAKRKQDEAVDEVVPSECEPAVVDVAALEAAYRKALAAFKAKKTDKDLRRARSAAKKAWDAAVASASQGGEQIKCRDCSQKFLFTAEERGLQSQMGWDNTPVRCGGCAEAEKVRRRDRSSRDNGKGRNMCYAFQTGECGYGDQCKFSHDPNFAGGKNGHGGDKVTDKGADEITDKGADEITDKGVDEITDKGADDITDKVAPLTTVAA